MLHKKRQFFLASLIDSSDQLKELSEGSLGKIMHDVPNVDDILNGKIKPQLAAPSLSML